MFDALRLFCQGLNLTYLEKCKCLDLKILKTFPTPTLCQILSLKENIIFENIGQKRLKNKPTESTSFSCD